MDGLTGPPGAEVPAAKPEGADGTNPDQPYDAAAYAQYWAAYYAAYNNYYGSAGFNGNGAEQAGGNDYAQPVQSAPQSNYSVHPQDMVGQPSHTVWVGGLPMGTTEQELRNLFSQFGGIENVKMLHEKNCAFVRFNEIGEAYAAHTKMQGQFIGGQQLKMGWGKPDEKDEGPPPCKNLWLGNIGPNTTEFEIERLFQQFSPIERIRVLPAKSCAFVTFGSLDAALEAKRKMQGAMLDGRPIKINFGKAGDNNDEGVQVLNPDYLTLGPPQPPAPIDPKQRSIIDKLAAYIVKNGPQMEEVTRVKQAGNPIFEFLTEGGKYHDYYRWKIFDCRRMLKEGNNPLQLAVQATASLINQTQQQGPPMAPTPTGPILNDAENSSLSLHLDTLVPTKESIKKGKDFIMSLPAKASAVAAFMCQRLQQTPEWTAKLNIIYLTNDVLHHSSKQREQNAPDVFCTAFKPFLAPMLYDAYHDQPADRQNQIEKLLGIWNTKQIFATSEIDLIIERMKYDPRWQQESNDQWGPGGGNANSAPNPQMLGGLHSVAPPTQFVRLNSLIFFLF
eukprot:TRINITY_DN338_c0_g1_i2.p1 TRINITY_DN338_c0_g1~~TRINITY_DN338_c0_g1_i2.p1  ORF type:complete len:559 (-),score=121.77 TRINITY_DN338_c0_g1_i2:711-2387(-)